MSASSSHADSAVAVSWTSAVAKYGGSEFVAAMAQIVPMPPKPAVVGEPMFRKYPRDTNGMPTVWTPETGVWPTIEKAMGEANLAKKWLRYCMEHQCGSKSWWETDLTSSAVAEVKLKIPSPHYFPKEFRDSLDLPKTQNSLVGGYFWYDTPFSFNDWDWTEMVQCLQSNGKIDLQPDEGVVCVEFRYSPMSWDWKRDQVNEACAKTRALDQVHPVERFACKPYLWVFVLYSSRGRRWQIDPPSSDQLCDIHCICMTGPYTFAGTE